MLRTLAATAIAAMAASPSGAALPEDPTDERKLIGIGDCIPAHGMIEMLARYSMFGVFSMRETESEAVLILFMSPAQGTWIIAEAKHNALGDPISCIRNYGDGLMSIMLPDDDSGRKP